MQQILFFRCLVEERVLLIKLVISEEIKDVVFKMLSNKFLGLDGFIIEFFKVSWSVISKDFITVVQFFFSKGFFSKGLNIIILVLISKKEEVIEMKDYRLILCCNVLYKVIFKIIVNRFKGIFF